MRKIDFFTEAALFFIIHVKSLWKGEKINEVKRCSCRYRRYVDRMRNDIE